MRKLLFVGLFLLLPMSVTAQEPAALKNTPKDTPKVEDKKIPETFSIPDARKDKVFLIQKDLKIIEFQLKDLERLYKEQQALQKQLAERWSVEFTSALRLAGVEEKDFPNYEINTETLVITKKKVDAPAKTP